MNGIDFRRVFAILAILGGIGLWIAAPPAIAAHDQGYPCYQCHSLNPTEIRSGSNSIRLDQYVLRTIPPNSPSPTTWSGGMPISCDFCHRSVTDVPTAKFALKSKKHPVDLIQSFSPNPDNTVQDNTTNLHEITCNDCHNGDDNGNAVRDLSSPSLTSRTPKQGYPDHDNVAAGYVHSLTGNPPHLTQPYWGSSLPGNRASDTTFWTGVRGGTQNMACWVCHDGVSKSPFTQVTATANVKSEYTGAGSAKGHQIRTTTGGSQLGAGSALPCYDCHDSHGSVNNALVLDSQSIYGVSTSTLSVTGYNQPSRPYNDKAVCAGCHDTGLGTTGTGTGTRVEGLNPVDPFNSGSTGSLHQSSGIADNMLNSTKNCLAPNGGCHASPHNPVGESTGGQACSVCHPGIYNAMKSGVSTGYHHVMLSDAAPSAGSYPVNPTPTTAASDRTCAICHVDHAYFSKLAAAGNVRARNLRQDITVQPDNQATANGPVQTDFDNNLTRGGICTSCHENVQAKNGPGTNIKDTTTNTPLVNKAIYLNGAHNYPSASPFIESQFASDLSTDKYRANCTKCHNDTLGTSFQTTGAGTFQFGLHASDANSGGAVEKILAPLGAPTPLSETPSETFCYRCHSAVTDNPGGTKKPTAGKDWYNNAPMSVAAEAVYSTFQLASRHPVAAADQAGGTKAVDCLNCHNVHGTRSATGSIAANPDNTYAFASYNTGDNSAAGIANRSNFCLACHDGTPPSYALTSAPARYVPATVAIPAADNVLMNKAANGARGHWSDNGSFTATTVKACDACHDKHGSTIGKLIDNVINGTAVAANNNGVCQACHNGSGTGYPAQEADRAAGDNGYFNHPSATPRWPGFAVWDNLAAVGGAPVSPHRNNAKTYAGFDGVSRNVNDCKTCHDVHGTAYPFDELKAAFRAGDYTLCLTCHGRTATASDNIAQYFPVAAGGLSAASTATTNVGHNVKSSGSFLAQGAALPCYDCHVTHGSAAGNSQLKSDQRWSGLGDTRGNDGNNRTFCLGCHVAADNAAVTGTVENLGRQDVAKKLKLPATNAIEEHRQASAQGCNRCHYGLNAGDNTYGPHYPATGLCDTCHESQGTRSAAAATHNGPHLAHVNAGTYRFACKQCHSWTATVSPAAHKNDAGAIQRAEVRFDNQSAGAWSTIQYATATLYQYRSLYSNPYGANVNVPAYAAGTDNGTDARQATVKWTNGQCGNVWCHSTGYPDNVARTPIWVSGTLPGDCTGCHGNNAASAAKMGSAGYGSPAHLAHINNNYECSACHRGTVAAGSSRTIAVYDNHVNGVVNVLAGDGYSFTYSGGGACANISCHNNQGANWFTGTGQVTCDSCHVKTTGDVDDFGTGTALSLQNGTVAGIDNNEWNWSGHGRDAGNYDVSANAPANLLSGSTGKVKCVYCHDAAVSHNNVANPFRLANSPGTNGTCNVCHTASAGGYQPPADATGNYASRVASTGARVDNNHYNLGSTNNARHSTLYNGGQFCWDCHDPHGDRNSSGSGNIFMVGKRVTRRHEGSFGIPTGGNDNSNRPSVVFTAVDTGASYASTDNAAPYDGVCEACHETASGITHYTSSGRTDLTHYTGKCTGCHTHNTGFRGSPGNNVEQFFDNGYRASTASNYNDLSRHPLQASTTTLTYPAEIDCYGCHGVGGTTYRSNECLTCHWENRTGAPQHPNGVLEWATPGTPGTQLGSFPTGGTATNDTLCLQCHGGGSSATLGGVSPVNVLPTGETWTGGSGHGSSARLSASVSVGPPAYHCYDCHYSTAVRTSSSDPRDNQPPGYHGSVNRKLVRNDNAASNGDEYPHPGSPSYTTADARSTQMDAFCSTKCHGNLSNGQFKDDNVVDHTWSVLGGQGRAGSLTHPTNMGPTPSARFRNPVNLPLSDYTGTGGAGFPGAGNEFCVTCHNPHGGGSLVDGSGASQTGGAKQMLRQSWKDTNSTLCKECHL